MMTILGEIVLPIANSAGQMCEQACGALGADGLSAGGASAVLAAVWFFFRVIRKIVATLFMFCVSYLVCKCCFGIDISGLIEPLRHLIGQ